MTFHETLKLRRGGKLYVMSTRKQSKRECDVWLDITRGSERLDCNTHFSMDKVIG